jgi:hypothetical protein
MWDLLIQAESQERGFAARWLGLLDAERYWKPPYHDESDLGTSEDPNSDLVQGRAFLRVDVASAAAAENLAQRAVFDAFPEAEAVGSDSVRFTIEVFAAQGSFTNAVERISQTLEEW